MSAKTVLEIKTNPRFRPTRTIFPFAMVAGMISLGIWTGSNAMQWAGFLFGFLTAVGFAAAAAKKDQGLTIAEARTRIDELERNETGQ